MPGELRARLTWGPLMGLAPIVAITIDLCLRSLWAVTILVTAALLTGMREYVLLMRRNVPLLPTLPLLASGLALVLITLPPIAHRLPSDLPLAGLILGVGGAWLAIGHMTRHGPREFHQTMGAAAFGLLWIGVPVHLFLDLAALDLDGSRRGLALLMITLAILKLGDVGAFFGGRAMGRHKMSPSISPGKTWEGFAWSLVGSQAGAWLFLGFLALGGVAFPFAHAWQAALYALIVAPLGVLGDLAESALKRSLGVKDSASILPGFGGFLDVLDALLLAAPIAYIMARIFPP